MKKSIVMAAIIICGASISVNAQWSLSGNSNATTTSKLGTTNAVPLNLTTNNVVRLYIGQNLGNIGIGTTNPSQKLDVNGNINLSKGYGLYSENHRVFALDSFKGIVFLGNGVGIKNTGLYNTAVGYHTFGNNTTGYYNAATGAFSLYANTTGRENVATGAYTLVSNTTGSQNTSNGVYSLYNNTTGEKNTAYGYQSLYFNSNASYNVAIGSGAMYNNTIGWFNTAIGVDALHSNTTAYGNVANGNGALYSNTDGGGNTAVGSSSLYSNISGSGNTAVGYHALTRNDGIGNTAVGEGALFFTENATGNTAVGFQSGYSYLHGYYNTFVGWNASSNQSGLYNTTALGSEATVTAANQVRIGNSSTTSIGGATGWSNLSDGRVKRNVKENVPGLAFINKLKPVTYNLDLDAADKITGTNVSRDENGKAIAKQLTPTEIAARAAKQKAVYTGFVAQDVEKAAKELGYDFSGVDAAKNDKDLYGLRYAEFVVPLVKAVQELSAKTEALSKENDELKKKVGGLEELEKRLKRLEELIAGKQPKASSFSIEEQKVVQAQGLLLGQNTPNPAVRSTRVSYNLSASSYGQLVVFDASGKTVKLLSLDQSGYVDINTAALSNGVYYYSLVVDNKTVATKKMTIAH